MKIHKCEQGSDEWVNLRKGKFTASSFHIFFGNSQTKKLKLLKKACEIITGKVEETFKNGVMEQGNELEDEARRAYEEHTLNLVEEVGFIERDSRSGSSPDGLVSKDGGIEIKCPIDSTFLKHIIKGQDYLIKPTYRTQIQYNFLCNGRLWCDYVAYNSNFKKKLYIKRVFRDEEYIERIKTTLDECNSEVDALILKYKNYKY